MNILIIGQGGREHALARKVAESTLVEHVYVAPGNAGTAAEPKVTNVDIDVMNIDGLLEYAKAHVDLTIVGPEAPLAKGIVDQFNAAQLACFGPSQACAKLEASKSFAKNFMQAANIPTARSETFSTAHTAKAYVADQSLPIVLKADGLAAGKGVIIAKTIAEANAAIDTILTKKQFGQAGEQLVIEEFLTGHEMSYIVMCDGKNFIPLATTQDHKARDNGNAGPNTGGMGAYSPANLPPALEECIQNTVIRPALGAMQAAGTPYVGFLYAGLMIDANQEVKVLEFNCRLGDPETQVILPRMKTDLVSLCQAALTQGLDNVTVEWDDRAAVTVVMAAKGYPETYPEGDVINGLSAEPKENTYIYHAGTKFDNDNVVTCGGRVLAVTALDSSIDTARQQAYERVQRISWNSEYYRTDIGLDHL